MLRPGGASTTSSRPQNLVIARTPKADDAIQNWLSALDRVVASLLATAFNEPTAVCKE